SIVLLLFSPIGFEMVANATRQGLATPFILMFYSFLWGRKYVSAAACFMIAAFLHKSSIPFCLLGFLGWTSLRVLVIAVLSLTVVYVLGFTSYLMAPLIAQFDISISDSVLEYGVNYGYR